MTGARHSARRIVTLLRRHASRRNVRGMARYGINPRGTLGVQMPRLRSLAKRLGTDHSLALSLWRTGIHEARILASLIADPDLVTIPQLERWIRSLDSWDVCDQLCANLLERAPVAARRMLAWARGKEEFVRRAGYVLMARHAVSDRRASDRVFLRYLDFILRHGRDERNLVRKAISWAIRQIGKRNRTLHRAALSVAAALSDDRQPGARWIGRDALRELRSAQVRKRLRP